MRTKLLLTGLLFAAVMQGAWAQTTVFDPCPVELFFSQNSMQVNDGNYSVQLRFTDGGVTGFLCGGMTWRFRYQYDVTWVSTTPPGVAFLGSVRIDSCGKPFCAQLPPERLAGSGGDPSKWIVNQAPFGGAEAILFEVDPGQSTPRVSGMPEMSTWRFTVYSNQLPDFRNLVLNASHCPTATSSDCRQSTGAQTCRVPCGELPPPPGECLPKKFNIAQVYPARFPSAEGQLVNYPAGCWMGQNTPTLFTNAVVPGVLCLDTNPTTHLLNLNAFIDRACCASPTVQSVTLVKTIPGSQKCPDTYRPVTYTQFGTPTDLTQIRTWWPLMYSMPGTTFCLTVRGVCHTGTPATFTDTYCWTVVANPEVFRLLIDWLHTSEIDLLEVPCIVGEDMYQALLQCASNLADAVQAFQMNPDDATARTNAQNVIFDCEGLIFMNTFFAEFVDQEFPYDYHNLLPDDEFPNGPPPNLSQPAPRDFPTQSGVIGILDTFENPCACKLIVDLESIGIRFGIMSSQTM
jgi:hypothetical protein